MNKYEALYIISTELDEETTAAKVAKFSEIITANGGEIVKTDEWGKRRLAYAINYQNEGYYVLTTFNGESELPKELERNYKNDEAILRYLVTRI